MNTNTMGRKALFGSLALGLACVFALSTGNASAADHGGHGHGGVSIGIGIGGGGYGGGYYRGGYGGGYYRGGYGGGYYSGGYYNGGYTCVESAPRVWVDGYYETVLSPVLICGNRYENRYIQVWHPGCYRY